MRTALILCIGLAFGLMIGGCKGTNGNNLSGTSIKQCEREILAMRDKVKKQQATKMDFFTLMKIEGQWKIMNKVFHKY